eukprot:359707-Chlamydomonas_euryale.AAC.3
MVPDRSTLLACGTPAAPILKQSCAGLERVAFLSWTCWHALMAWRHVHASWTRCVHDKANTYPSLIAAAEDHCYVTFDPHHGCRRAKLFGRNRVQACVPAARPSSMSFLISMPQLP